MPSTKRLTAALLIPCVLAVALTQVTWASHAAPAPPAVKGVALLNWSYKGDLALVGAPLYYGWGAYCPPGDAACTNMNRNWTLPQTCYDTLLLGNEPTNHEPAGHPVSATVAASVTVAIENACPQTRLVAANIHLNNWWTLAGQPTGGQQEARDWLASYLAAYAQMAGKPFGEPHRLGVHCYSQWASHCLDRLREFENLVAYDGPYWLTEFGLYGSPPDYTNAEQLSLFLAQAPLLHPRVERYYLWTNRDADGILGWPFNLVGADGTLTEMGQVYAAWEPPSVSRAWLPAVNPLPQGYP